MTTTAPHRQAPPPVPDLRGFACFVIDGAGRVLLVRRAWPALWSHALDGRARPAEPMTRAVARHGRDDLGLALVEPVCVRPGTIATRGVYLASVTGRRDPDPARVLAHRWVDPEELGRAVVAAPWALSPALVELVRGLGDLPAGETLEVAG
ncbi:NUDIX domain-containing protein [Georgenia ruanii]|uniref:NUDIX domain-containing protein n=1 Tax=Georgenia ruanii TaxID=348442 RepID=A0A7J9UTJ8_9MICO|nr:NUDIX domain-containing protein [Georgenia ruanii]MPV87928.1 NUDIX domain-containing protein [Georgenia ruanii]